MTKRTPATRESCGDHCRALRVDAREPGYDPPLPLEHAGCAWKEIRSYVRQLSVKTLKAYPASAILGPETDGAEKRNVWAFQCARYKLASDSALLDDLVQEVACEFVDATRRGCINAAVPALFGWAKVATYRIVVRAAKPAVVLAIGSVGASTRGRDGTDELADVADYGRAIDGNDGEDVTADDTALVRHAAAKGQANLTPARRVVLVQWLAGKTVGAIARELGISRVAASLRLMHARRLLLEQA